MNYLLSIVVPTKDRYYYLKNLIELILSFNSDEIELVIQDNTLDNSEILDYLGGISCAHIVYNHQKEQIPISDNATNAILNSSGEYVCFIGDDDGVTNGIIDQVKEMKKNGYDAMLTRNTIYNWPDYKDDSIFHLSGVMTLSKSVKNHVIDSKRELKKACDNGFLNLGCLPRVYQGVVKRSVLDELYKRCGSFFPGPSPDMANAVALTYFVDKVWYSDCPTIITGQCKSVGGGERLLDKLVSLTDVSHLPKDILSYWDNNLPTLWCTDTIWPGSAYVAANRVGIELDTNYNRIYGHFVFNHPSYKETISQFKRNCLLVEYYKYRLFFHKLLTWFLNRVTYYLSSKKKIQSQMVFRNLSTIKEANNILSKML